MEINLYTMYTLKRIDFTYNDKNSTYYISEAEYPLTYDKDADVIYLTSGSSMVCFKIKIGNNILTLYDMSGNSFEFTKIE